MPWEPTALQRFLTIEFINKRRLYAPAVWLKPESLIEADVTDTHKLNTNLEDWRSEDDERNLGVRLIDGFVELRIQVSDELWFRGFFDACRTFHIDARAAYGGARISSIIFKVEDATTIEGWRNLWIGAVKDKDGQWIKTEFDYSILSSKAKPDWRHSFPLPGSRFASELIAWRPWGKPAAATIDLGMEDLEIIRPLAGTSMESICRAVSFATLAYWVRIYLDGLEEWDESLTRILGGWIARLVREGRDINARNKSLDGICWAPIDSPLTAAGLLTFLMTLGAGKDLSAAFERANVLLERNPVAPVPGWTAIETLFGPQAKAGLRRAFRAGLNIDLVEMMSDQYVYDRTSHDYLDRDELLKGIGYAHSYDDMIGRHQNESTKVGKKLYNPFWLYARSSLRTDVQHREFRPGHEPGAILRYSPVHGLLNGEDRQPDEFRLLNTFAGFTIKPITVIDPGIMRRAVSMLDRMLGLLTQDNDAQMLWMKKLDAQLIQAPHIKPQVCLINIGGQGIGKSIWGQDLQTALLGTMAGTADAASLAENKFMIAPFVGKLIVFIDEVKLESVGAINIIKKLVRQQHVSGQFKFQDQRDHYIPSRLMIASNSSDIGLTPQDAADRAFFFVMAWTAENKRMTDREFQDWALTLKPFYSEFITALENVDFKRHLMRYFMDLEVSRAELEDLTHSSRNDENVVRSTMSKAREVARGIVADARVLAGMDITAWFSTPMLREAIRRVDGGRSKVEPSDVLTEFRRANVVETMRGDLHRFLYKYGTLLQKMGEAHNLPITNNWDFQPDDWGDTDVMYSGGGNPWRGNRQRKQQGRRSDDSDDDIDAMPDF